MGAKLSVLGLIMFFSQYLRSAMVRFPLPFILDKNAARLPCELKEINSVENRKNANNLIRQKIVFSV